MLFSFDINNAKYYAPENYTLRTNKLLLLIGFFDKFIQLQKTRVTAPYNAWLYAFCSDFRRK